MTDVGLAIAELHVRYGAAEALHGITFQTSPGCLTVLLGRNGAGKSTTLQAIGGFVPRSSGSVQLDGADLPNGAPRRCVERGVVYVPETRRLFPGLSVQDNLRVGRPLAGEGPKTRYTPEFFRARFEIVDRLWRRTAGTLSGGEQQFVAVCRGFCLRPRVMLIDEVSQGLAPKAAIPLIELVADYVAEGGIAVVAEQNLKIATELSKRTDGQVLVFASGEVTSRGHWQEVLQAEVVQTAVGIRAAQADR